MKKKIKYKPKQKIEPGIEPVVEPKIKSETKHNTAKKEKRVSIGIKNFDSLVNGGFLPGSINLIVGGVGSGKTVFASQFLIDGLIKSEPVLYICLGEKKEDIFEYLSKFGWNLKKFEDSGKLSFLEYSPEGIKQMIDEGGGEMESIIIKKKIKRIVIDSLNFFEMMFKNKLERNEALTNLCGLLHNWNCTTIITLQREIGAREMASDLSIEFETDSIVILYFLRKDSTRKRQLEILKMKETEHSKKLHDFGITSKGIIVKK